PIPSPFGPQAAEQARAPVVRVTEGTAWAERQPPPTEADDPFAHLGTGSLSRLALTAYLRSRLEGAPPQAGPAHTPPPPPPPLRARRPRRAVCPLCPGYRRRRTSPMSSSAISHINAAPATRVRPLRPTKR